MIPAPIVPIGLVGLVRSCISIQLLLIYVLFCSVWLATLGMPVVAPGTAAGPFRRVVEAPFWVPSSPVVERGALSTEVPPPPPTLNEVRCPGIADPVIHGQASAVLEPTPHVSGLSGDIVENFWPPCAPRPPQWSGRY